MTSTHPPLIDVCASVPTFVHALLVVAVLGEGVGDGVGRLAQNLLRPSDRFRRRGGRRLVVGDIFDVDVVIVVLVACRSEEDAGSGMTNHGPKLPS